MLIKLGLRLGGQLTLVLAALGLAVSHAGNAAACSVSGCRVGQLLPAEGKVPANQLAWVWQPARGFPGENEDGAVQPDVQVFIEGESDTVLELERSEQTLGVYLLTPKEAPKAGTILRVEHTNMCPDQAESFRLEVTPAVTPPSRLGKLSAKTQSGYLDFEDYSAGCTSRLEASYADVAVTLSSDAKSFADSLSYSLEVDGKAFRSGDVIYEPDDRVVPSTLAGGPLGPGKERVYALCESTDAGSIRHGVSPGKHKLTMVARLPLGETLRSDELQVDLSCPDASATGSHSASAKDPDDESSSAGCALAKRAPSAPGVGFGLLLGVVGLTTIRRKKHAQR
jgi:hypothetical protein